MSGFQPVLHCPDHSVGSDNRCLASIFSDCVEVIGKSAETYFHAVAVGGGEVLQFLGLDVVEAVIEAILPLIFIVPAYGSQGIFVVGCYSPDILERVGGVADILISVVSGTVELPYGGLTVVGVHPSSEDRAVFRDALHA